MAIIEFNIPRVSAAIDKRLEDALDTIGALGVSWASDNLRANGSIVSSNLINSLAWSTARTASQTRGTVTKRAGKPSSGVPLQLAEDKLAVRIGTNVVYAAIQEFGGTIVPVDAGALTVPIHPLAKKAASMGLGARSFPDLVLIERVGRPPLLVRIKDKGRNKRFDIMYVLLPKVVIPAKPYLRPALTGNRSKILAIFARAVNG